MASNVTSIIKIEPHGYHHHLFAQYVEMNSKICNVPDRKANSCMRMRSTNVAENGRKCGYMLNF